jgi:hypothetical protein
MTVQDDAREQELCNLFNLDWDPRHARGGTDAVLDWTHDGQTMRIEFEALNNPHVTKSFLARFDNEKITRDHASGLRRKLTDYLKAHT